MCLVGHGDRRSAPRRGSVGLTRGRFIWRPNALRARALDARAAGRIFVLSFGPEAQVDGPNGLLLSACIADFLPMLRFIAAAKIPRHEREMWRLNRKMADLLVVLATLQEKRTIDRDLSVGLRLMVLRVKTNLCLMGAPLLQESAANAAAALDNLPRNALVELVEIEDDWLRSPAWVSTTGLVLAVGLVILSLGAPPSASILVNAAVAVYLGICLIYELRPNPEMKDFIITMHVTRIVAGYYELTARQRRLIRFFVASMAAVLLMASFTRAAVSLYEGAHSAARKELLL